MFDLGVKNCDGSYYLSAIKTIINHDLTDSQIKDLARDLVEKESDLYKFALNFVHGFCDEYCKRHNSYSLYLLFTCNNFRKHLSACFLEHFLIAYYCECDVYLKFDVLDFAYFCMYGLSAPEMWEYKFKNYFDHFYTLFECDLYDFKKITN